jgi:hypothetical protein
MSDGGKQQVFDLAGNLVSVVDAEAPEHTHPKADITDFPHEHEYADLSGVAAAEHDHALADITDYVAPDDRAGISVIFDAPQANDQLDVVVPFDCTITGVTLLADTSGSVVIDIWKDTYANFPPTDADSIVAGANPLISAATKSTDTTLTGWTKTLAAGDVLRFNVDSVATITRVSLALAVTRT